MNTGNVLGRGLGKKTASTRKSLLVAMAVLGASWLGSQGAKGASQSWVGLGVDGSWSTTANWSGGATPGDTTGGITSPDIATFNAAIVNTWGVSAANPVVIGSALRNISGITFDTAAGNYFIGSTSGNSLFLTDGGSIQMLSTLTATNAVETINAPLVFEGNYGFANNSANGTGVGAGRLVFGGTIQGANGGTETLTLSGSNTNANTISGIISNGTAGSLAVVKSGTGQWVLSGTNTFSGGTTLNAGTLDIGNASALGSGTFSAAANTSLNVTAAFTIAGGISENFDGNITFVGTNTLNTGTGAVTFNNSPVITVSASTLTIGGPLSITSGNGFTKAGAGGLTLAGAGNTWTGTGTVNAGTLTLASDQPGNSFIVNGGTLSPTAAQSSVQSYTVNSGGTLNLTAGKNVLLLAAGTSITANPGSTITMSTYLANTNNITVVGSGASAPIVIGGGGGDNGTAAGTELVTFSGNGNISWSTSASLNSLNQSSSLLLNTWGNFGGTVNWTNSNNIRLSGSTATILAPYATINLGSGTASLFPKGTGTIVFGALQGSGTGESLNSGSSGTSTYNIGSANTSTTFAGEFLKAAGNTLLTKIGTGTLTLNGNANTATGLVSANGGTLQLDYSLHASNILNTAVPLSFGGGKLRLLGNPTAATATTQTVGNVAVAAGGGALVLDTNGGLSTTLTMGTITATTTGGTLNITTLGTGIATVTTTTAPLAAPNGTYGPRITYGNDWATSVSVATPYTLSAYSGYTAMNGSTDLATTNYSVTGSLATAAPETVLSLKLVPTAVGQALDLTNGALTLASGGLLFSDPTNDYAVNNGTLVSGTTGLIVQQLSTARTLTINSIIADGASAPTAFTKGGPGTVVLTGINTYTGASFLNAGVVSIGSNANLGNEATGATLNINGGTLLATGGTAFGLYFGGPGSSDRAIVIGGGGGTFNVAASTSLTIDGVISNPGNQYGPLVKAGAGTLVLSNAANTYLGATIISGGVLSVNTLANSATASSIGASASAAPALVLDGGTLQYTGGGVSTDRTFTLTQNGGTIDATGGGPLTFTNTAPIVPDSVLAGSGARSLTFTGDVAGNTFASQIINGTGGVTTLNKTGPGSWILTNPSHTYTGNTNISGTGTLALAAVSANPIATSAKISVASGATLDVTGLTSGKITLGAPQTLTGAGTVIGGVLTSKLNATTASHIAPGDSGLGTLNLESLTMVDGSLYDYEFTTAASDRMNVSDSAGLTINGGVFNIYALGTVNPLVQSGNHTYTLIGYSGGDTLGGDLNSILSINNPISGLTYTFADTGSTITLNIQGTPITLGNWIVDGSSTWNSAASWSSVPDPTPNVAGATASFGGSAATHANLARTVTVGTETVGTVLFASPNGESYTLSSGALTLDNLVNDATITVSSGTHTIDATSPITLNSDVNITVIGTTSALTIGSIGGAGKNVSKNGTGLLVLSGANTYGPASGTVGTTLSAGTLRLGDNAALSTGDLLATGGTLQSGAAGLVIANNIQIGISAALAVDSNSNSLTLSGLISDRGGDGILNKVGAGTVVLTSNNTYGGATSITTGTLQLGNGGVGGSVAGPIVNNGVLLLNRSDDFAMINNISGTGSLTQAGTDNVTLSGLNTFAGLATLSSGTLTLGNSQSLSGSTVNFAGGALGFGTLTAATIGGLTGSQNEALVNASAAAVILSLGNNNTNTTYSGALTGAGSLIKVGSGTTTLLGANSYTGDTTVTMGVLLVPVSGALGTGATQGNGLVPLGSVLNISGGTVTFAALSYNSGAQGPLTNNGVINVTGTLAINTDNGNQGGVITYTSGTVNAGSLTIGRSTQNNSTTIQTSGSTGVGLYVNGATINVATTLTLAPTTITNSSPNMRIDSGSVTVGGVITVTESQSTRYGVLDVNGGTLTSNDTSGVGIQIGGNFPVSWGELLVRGTGVVTTPAVTLGNAAQTSGNNVLELLGGTLYIGAGGIVNGGSSSVPIINVGSTAVATFPTIGASADWSSSLNMTLTNNSAGGTPIFQAGSAASVAHNITLTGVLSGAGGLTETGGGKLSLGAANTYTGGTTVNSGTLSLDNTTGSATGTGGLTLKSGTTLAGGGTASGAVHLLSGAILAPGNSTINSGVGTLTVGSLTLDAGTILNMELSSFATPNDTINVTASGGLTINGGALNFLQAGTVNPYEVNGLYNLFSYSGTIGGTGFGALTIANQPGDKVYTLGNTGSVITLQVTTAGVVPAYWNIDASGNWGTGTNWTGGIAPDSAGTIASFGGGGVPITAPRTITLTADRTVGEIDFNSPIAYTIAGANTINLDGGGPNPAVLDVISGNHAINTPINLVTGTSININNSADSLTLGGVISGSVGLVTKIGSGTLVLTQANTYNAPNNISGGKVVLSGSGTLGAASNDLTMAGGTLDLATSSQSVNNLILTGGAILNGTLTPSTITTSGGGSSNIAANLTGGATMNINSVGAGKLILSGDNSGYFTTIMVNSGTLQVGNGAATGNIGSSTVVDNGTVSFDRSDSVNVANSISGSGGVSQIGSGTTTLSGSNSFDGSLLVTAGKLVITGSVTSSLTNGIVVGNGAANAVLAIQTGANISRNMLAVGSAGGAGAVYQTDGSVTFNQAAGATDFQLAAGANSYGYYGMSAGTLTTNELGVGGGNSSGTSAGIFEISGGNVTVNGWLTVARGSQAANTTDYMSGLLNVKGGTITLAGATGTYMSLDDTIAANGTSVINIANGSIVAQSEAVRFGTNSAATAGHTGIINLLPGGLLSVAQIIVSAAPPTDIFNFSGGTLQASPAASAAFLSAANLDQVNVYGAGGTIDNNSASITIGNNLLAPAGSGVSIAGGTLAGGSGYIAPPLVSFTGGGGIGASGYAVLTGGAVSSIVITSPGTGYTAPATVVFTGGGATTAASVATTFSLNTSGGMTFTGSGITTVSGANTFTGSVTVNQGTLQIATFNANGVAGALGAGTGPMSIGTVGDPTVVNLEITGTSAASNKGINIANGGTANIVVDNTLANITFSGPINGAGTLNLAGPGSVTLTGTSGYTGGTTINGGKLTVSGAGSINSSSSININGSSTLLVTSSVAMTPTVNLNQGFIDGTGTLGTVIVSNSSTISNGNGTAATLTINNLTFNSSGTLILKTTVPGGAPAISTTALKTITQDNNISLTVTTTSPSWAAGTYDLIKYSTYSFTGGNTSSTSEFALNTGALGLSNRQTAALGLDGNNIALIITGSNPFWTGNGNGQWTSTPGGANQNFSVFTTPPTSIPTDYQDGSDIVTFDDNANASLGGTITVKLAQSVSPLDTIFNNNSRNYIVDGSSLGSFAIAAGSLVKSGTGTVTLNSTNYYGGNTTLNAGTLIANASNALGFGTLIINGGVLDSTNPGTVLSNPQVWAGDFAVTGTQAIDFQGAVTLNQTTNITINGAGATFEGGISGTGFGLNKTGTGALTLAGTGTFSGTTLISAGPLTIQNTLALQNSTLDLEGTSTANFGDQTAITLGALQGVGNISLNNNSAAAVQLTAGGNGSSTTYSGIMSGVGGFTKAGAGTFTLTSANTYTGPTTITSGKIVISASNNLGDATSVTNTLSMGVATLEFTASNYDLGVNRAIALTGGTGTAAFQVDTGTLTVSGALSGTGRLVKTGPGTLLLSGANNSAGTTEIRQGALSLSGTWPVAGNNGFIVSSLSGSNAILNILPGANITHDNIRVGGDTGSTGANGAVYQTGGSFTSPRTGDINSLALGNAINSYGYYSLSGGTINTNEFGISGGNSTGNSQGILDISGGTLTDNGWMQVVRGGSSGVLNMTGGTIVLTGTVAGTALTMSDTTTVAGTAVINIANGSILGPNIATFSLNLAETNTTGQNSIVNLLPGGVLQISRVLSNSANPVAMFNFNGGTLRASGSNAHTTDFFVNTNIDGAYVYGNGGTVDNNGVNITLGVNLRTPTGNGIGVSLLTGGSGYIGAPVVTFTGGGGSDATGYATIDPTTGVVTGIVITSPGVGYTSPATINFAGGGVGAVLPTATVSLSPNALTGGMTFTGSGTTTITGTNTYTGGTTVNGGTLITTGFTLPAAASGNAVTVNAGAVYQLANTAATHTSPLSLSSNAFSGTPTSYFNFNGGKLSLGTNLSNTDVIITGGAASESTMGLLIAPPTQVTLGVKVVWQTASVLTGAEYTQLTGKSGLTTAAGFDSTLFAAGDLLLRYGLAGDVTGSGLIDIDDYLAIDQGYSEHLPATYAHGDFNHDGTINAADYAMIDLNALDTANPLAAGEISLHTAEFGAAYTDAFSALSTSAVPEPASLLLLGVGAMGLISRRRRRS